MMLRLGDALDEIRDVRNIGSWILMAELWRRRQRPREQRRNHDPDALAASGARPI